MAHPAHSPGPEREGSGTPTGVPDPLSVRYAVFRVYAPVPPLVAREAESVNRILCARLICAQSVEWTRYH